MTLHLLKYVVLYSTIYIQGIEGQSEDRPTITVEDGTIRGRRGYTVGEGHVYYSFRGIPFAEPPVEQLRFKSPQKNSKWKGILDATKDKSPCMQGGSLVIGSEDCLYINVYTPSLNQTGYSVMVWIHGDSFINGDSSYSRYGPDYLLEEGIIYVSFNYRLGAFGFLSTEDLTCPGNMGLKDQALALNWVQKNIKYFGGNSSRVTIFGQDAGSASVSYLLQSKSTKGLFRAAIMESGTSLCLWALNRRARETAFVIGRQLGIFSTSSKLLVRSLRYVNATLLQQISINVSTMITLENPLGGIYFGPVIEPDQIEAFFTSFSDQLLREGKFHTVPLLAGLNSNEAAYLDNLPDPINVYFGQYDTYLSKLAPADLSKKQMSRILATGDIKFHYFALVPIAMQPEAIIKFINDDQLNRPIRRTVQDTMNYTNVYIYKFSYQGQLGEAGNRTYKGVGHGEELGYLFRRSNNSEQVPNNDKLIRARMVRLWTNFAKYLNPTPKADPVLQKVTWYKANQSSSLAYLNIDLNLTNQVNPFSTEMNFWDSIYAKYGDPPYNTY